MGKIKITKETVLDYMKTVVLIFIGNFILACGIMIFVSPMNFMTGGATGLALLMERVAGIPLSTTVAVLNVICFIIGYIFLGKRFSANTLLSTFLYPMALRVLESIPAVSTLNTDPLLGAVFGGLMIGFGVGLVIRVGASTGGMDVVPIIITKKTGIAVAYTMNAVDILIMCTQIPYSTPQILFYSIVIILCTTIAMDKVAMLGVTQTQVMIMSEKYMEINNAIHEKIDRGTTLLESVTGHLKHPQKVVMSVINNRELHALTNVVKEVDPNAFMVVNRVNEVHGNGFSFKLDDKQRIEALKNK